MSFMAMSGGGCTGSLRCTPCYTVIVLVLSMDLGREAAGEAISLVLGKATVGFSGRVGRHRLTLGAGARDTVALGPLAMGVPSSTFGSVVVCPKC